VRTVGEAFNFRGDSINERPPKQDLQIFTMRHGRIVVKCQFVLKRLDQTVIRVGLCEDAPYMKQVFSTALNLGSHSNKERN
jgi:hypothetical protein